MPVEYKTKNIDFGPCHSFFGDPEEFLGETQGESTVNYGIDTFALETEERGRVDEIITSDTLEYTIPIVYTDVETLSKVIPWAKLEEDADGEQRLLIPKAVGKRLSEYAKPLRVHPKHKDEEDKSRDIYMPLAYPKPGPINFGYARNGTRIANVTFAGMESEDDKKYLIIGDPDLTPVNGGE